MKKLILKSRSQIHFITFFFLISLFAMNVKAGNQKIIYNCDVKDNKNFASQISLEVYSDHLLALETTKTEPKSFYVLKVQRDFSKIKAEEKDDKIHSWYSAVVIKGDFKSVDEFPETKNNQEVVLMYLSQPKKSKAKLEIYINRLFYSQSKTENLDFKGFCNQAKP